MKRTKLVLLLTLSIGLTCVIFYAVRPQAGLFEWAWQATQARPESISPAVRPEREVIVYYFHGNFRCVTCQKLEDYTRQAVTTGFGQELEQGRLGLQVVNSDAPANEHFKKDYRLTSRAVVLATFEHGTQTRWRNLDRIWDLVDSEADFCQYIQAQVAAELKSRD